MGGQKLVKSGFLRYLRRQVQLVSDFAAMTYFSKGNILFCLWVHCNDFLSFNQSFLWKSYWVLFTGSPKVRNEGVLIRVERWENFWKLVSAPCIRHPSVRFVWVFRAPFLDIWKQTHFFFVKLNLIVFTMLLKTPTEYTSVNSIRRNHSILKDLQFFKVVNF